MNEEQNNGAPEDEPRSEVSFEPEEDPSRIVEDEAELGDIGAAQAKLKKLKAELAEIKKERQEYLDGWQRCKADSVNAKREALSASARAAEMLREALVHDIIPVLDSFDMAADSNQWATIDEGWRSGMENVRSQLLEALQSHGVKRYGTVGEMFDPQLHDAAQEISDVAGETHSVVKILRYGYRSGDRVLRPAQVVIKV